MHEILRLGALLLVLPALLALPAMAQRLDAGSIRSWGYQLQNIDPNRLAGVPYDAIVIDYSRDGSEAGALTAEEVARLKRKPDGSRRIVLAYMSIGEAETYRYYWKPWWRWFKLLPLGIGHPTWLGRLNGDWAGNYAVRYWDPAWQEIILGNGGYLDRLLKAGFDGTWLDKVDSSIEDVAAGRPTAKADMIAFVKRIGDKARARQAGFLVFPQNGEALLDDPTYRAAIDGFGKEDLLFGEEGMGKANTREQIAQKAGLLRPLVEAGKPVLAVEYIDDPAQIAAARERLAALGFVPHFAEADLSQMRIGDAPTDAKPIKAAKGRRRGDSREASGGRSGDDDASAFSTSTLMLICAAGAIVLIGMLRRR